MGGDVMKAMITGATSGIGYDMAKYLAEKNYELILIGRNKEKLEALQQELPTKTKVVIVDLANEQKVKELCVLTKNEDIDLLINNAGFGVFGDFCETDVAAELEMIDVNIKAVHILTKFFLKEMQKKDQGIILNVASSAAFYAGPLFSSYYASKSYVYKLSLALAEELHKKRSHVQVSILCPGPVATNFNERAGVSFSVKPLSSSYVAQYAIDQCLAGKIIIIPGTKMKLAKFFSHFLSDKQLAKITYKIQKKKVTSDE